ncbi:hypothetical protein EXS73_01005 [Candidatus Pacearchaeota archaeon]|nr:hypothetical protein [Candidatus Pacearchaeota archaeon]
MEEGRYNRGSFFLGLGAIWLNASDESTENSFLNTILSVILIPSLIIAFTVTSIFGCNPLADNGACDKIEPLLMILVILCSMAIAFGIGTGIGKIYESIKKQQKKRKR